MGGAVCYVWKTASPSHGCLLSDRSHGQSSQASDLSGNLIGVFSRDRTVVFKDDITGCVHDVPLLRVGGGHHVHLHHCVVGQLSLHN